MAELYRRPVTASQIRATPEWRKTYPGAEVVYEQDADEGEGSGFDNLDRGASAWTFFRVAASWEQVVDDYAVQLTDLGWHRTDAGGPYWTHQTWTSPERPGEYIAVTDRPPQPWAAPWNVDPAGGTVFSLFHRVDPAARTATTDA